MNNQNTMDTGSTTHDLGHGTPLSHVIVALLMILALAGAATWMAATT